MIVLKLCLIASLFIICSCSTTKIIEVQKVEENECAEIDGEEICVEEESVNSEEALTEEAEEPVDPYKIEFEINPNVKKHDYIKENFIHDNSDIKYINDDRYYIRRGIDISKHDKNVNWKKVKKSGIEFVFLRVGYRGYQTGILHLDKRFRKNIKKALEAGLDVGLYVFSQALTEEEAIEEAELCLREIEGYEIQLPIAYDPESIPWEWARTDDITMEQVTKNTIAFINRIKEAGYEPIIYSNLNWEVHYFDLEQLGECRIWYADYREFPKTPYHFDFWQYGGESGRVKGIKRRVDVDIQILKNEKVYSENQLEQMVE